MGKTTLKQGKLAEFNRPNLSPKNKTATQVAVSLVALQEER
jgi:hypothetical protein